MGSLKSRVESLERRLNVCEDRQDLSDFHRWGEIFTNMAKDEKAKSGSSDIIETGHLESCHIKVNDEPVIMKIEKEKCYVKMEIKDILGKTQGEIFQGNFSIKKFFVDGDINDRAKMILARKHQFDVEKTIWNSIFNCESINAIRDEYIRLEKCNEKAKHLNEDWKTSYELKEGIDGITVIRTLGMIYVSNKESEPAIKKAKKMGLLDLWFNKVIR